MIIYRAGCAFAARASAGVGPAIRLLLQYDQYVDSV